MRSLLLLFALVGMGSTLAAAEWSGFYGGPIAGVGLGSSTMDVKTRQVNSGSGFWMNSQSDVDQINGLPAQTASSSAFAGGLSLGYNWQKQDWVFGLEADFSALGLESTRVQEGSYNSVPTWKFKVTQTLATDWISSVRPRVGYAFGDWLFQASGGLALANRRLRGSFYDHATTGYGLRLFSDASELATGWAVGLGAEYRFGGRYGATLDYLYSAFGKAEFGTASSKDSDGVAYPDPFWFHFDMTVQVIRAGLNWHF